MSALATVDHSDSDEEGFGLAGVFTCEVSAVHPHYNNILRSDIALL